MANKDQSNSKAKGNRPKLTAAEKKAKKKEKAVGKQAK